MDAFISMIVSGFTFDSLLVSFLICAMLRQVFILTLSDSIAGPGGWLVDTR